MNNREIATPLYFAVQYDFDKDGGAIGNIFTGVVIPGDKLLCFLGVQIITPCVGAGNLNFGVLGALSLYGTYPAASFGANRTALGAATTIGTEVIISISGAPLTAGKIHIGWTVISWAGR